MDKQRYLKNVSTLEYDSSLCIGCKTCIEVCPHNVFRMAGKKVEIINSDSCMECGACDINCSTHALRVSQGVGCAAALISGFLNGKEPGCDSACNAKCC